MKQQQIYSMVEKRLKKENFIWHNKLIAKTYIEISYYSMCFLQEVIQGSN